jgi:heme-binding NEAT domain protein
MPHTNLHKVINLAKVHNHIASTGYIYKKDYTARFSFEMVSHAGQNFSLL